MPNPIDAVTGEIIYAATYGNPVISRLMLVYADTTAADADTPTPEQGQIRFITNPGLIQFYDGAIWTDWRRLFDPWGWRDPRASWGWLDENVATPADPVNTDLVLITAHMTYTTISGSGMGPLTVDTVASRQLAIEGYMRLDGGLFSSDGTAMVRIQRTTPSPKTCWEAVVAVPSLSVAGGGASTVIPLKAWDTPGGGAYTYELQVAKRVPVDSTTGLRVRAPCAIAAIDYGPFGP